MDVNLDKMLKRVQAALDRAEHPDTPPEEAQLSRAMAERIMTKYRLEEEQVRQTRLASGTAVQPVRETVWLTDALSPYRYQYWDMFYWIAKHVGIRARLGRRVDPTDGNYRLVGYVVGFEPEIALAQLMFNSLRLHFSERLEPKYNPALAVKDNIYRLRSAGLERPAIIDILIEQDPAGGWKRGQSGNRVTDLYVEACQDRGEDPKVVGRQTNAATYRQSFADSYVTRIYIRLQQMRTSAGLESGALILANRQVVVDEEVLHMVP